MEWTPARIRLLRDMGLCESQHDFAKTLGVAKRTIGNAERGAHPPSLALRRALDETLEHASDTQRDRFLTAVAAHDTTPAGTRGRSTVASSHPPRTLDGLRSAVLGMPPAVPDSNWLWTAFGPTNVAIHQLSVQSRLGNAKKAAQVAESIDTDALPAMLRGRRSQVHLELGWAAAGQGDDALAVLHLLEAERVAEQAVSRNASARTLLDILLARERRSVTPGLRGLASRAGLLP
ncbi:MAG: helix-turn-helix transcriptional regulator [Pseudonocardiaceae bacterium]